MRAIVPGQKGGLVAGNKTPRTDEVQLRPGSRLPKSENPDALVMLWVLWAETSKVRESRPGPLRDSATSNRNRKLNPLIETLVRVHVDQTQVWFPVRRTWPGARAGNLPKAPPRGSRAATGGRVGQTMNAAPGGFWRLSRPGNRPTDRRVNRSRESHSRLHLAAWARLSRLTPSLPLSPTRFPGIFSMEKGGRPWGGQLCTQSCPRLQGPGGRLSPLLCQARSGPESLPIVPESLPPGRTDLARSAPRRFAEPADAKRSCVVRPAKQGTVIYS